MQGEFGHFMLENDEEDLRMDIEWEEPRNIGVNLIVN